MVKIRSCEFAQLARSASPINRAEMNAHGWRALLIAGVVLSASCSKRETVERPSALSICMRFTSVALVTNCEPTRPGDLSASARDLVKFSVENYHPGQVLTFATQADYDRTVAAFSSSAAHARAYRYGNARRLVLIQLDEKVSDGFRSRIRDALDRL